MFRRLIKIYNSNYYQIGVKIIHASGNFRKYTTHPRKLLFPKISPLRFLNMRGERRRGRVKNKLQRHNKIIHKPWNCLPSRQFHQIYHIQGKLFSTKVLHFPAVKLLPDHRAGITHEPWKYYLRRRSRHIHANSPVRVNLARVYSNVYIVG